jgi:hypothetical protein
MQLMVTIEDPAVIQGILAHLGLPSVGAAARAEQPGPGARATAEVCAERPGGRRPLAASRLRFDLSRAL